MPQTDQHIDRDIGYPAIFDSDKVVKDDIAISAIIDAVRSIQTTTIVSCPLEPLKVPGVTAGAYTANDCVGTVIKLAVPKRGIIISATWYDLSDLGTQYDLEIFKHDITEIGDNGAWSPTDSNITHFVTEIAFEKLMVL